MADAVKVFSLTLNALFPIVIPWPEAQFFYALADQLARILGQTVMTVIVRLSSSLLVCIGVQIMWNGISALLASLRL